jgi:hypothetical protein
MTVYIFVCYMVMLGMIIEAFQNERPPFWAYVVFVLSPILIPIFIGMMLAERSRNP